jgi:predicted MFS family arabinose efflux permease
VTRPIRLLLIASSLWYFSEGLLGPLFAVFSEQIGGDILDITGAWAMYLIASGIAYPVVGRLLNTSRWKFRMIAVGYALNTVFTFGYLLVNDTTDLLLVQIGLGVAEAIATPSWDAFFASKLHDTRDTFAWGIASGHTQFISGVAIAIGGLIASYASFRAVFLVMGLISLAATVVQVRLSVLEERADADTPATAS